MYLHGRVSHIHPNGRFNYVGAPQTRADGVPVAAVPLIAKARAEARVAAAEEGGRKHE